MLLVDFRCGKFMVFGVIFGCFEDCVVIVVIFSMKSLFVVF